jgi:autotransporter-like protein
MTIAQSRLATLEIDSLTVPNAQAAFNAISGEIYGSLSTIGIETNESFLRKIAWRLSSRSLNRRRFGYQSFASNVKFDDSQMIVRGQNSCGRTSQTWAEGYGVGANFASDGNASGLNYSTGGTVFGLERELNSNTIFGIAGGYSQTGVALDDRYDRGTIQARRLSTFIVSAAAIIRPASPLTVTMATIRPAISISAISPVEPRPDTAATPSRFILKKDMIFTSVKRPCNHLPPCNTSNCTRTVSTSRAPIQSTSMLAESMPIPSEAFLVRVWLPVSKAPAAACFRWKDEAFGGMSSSTRPACSTLASLASRAERLRLKA